MIHPPVFHSELHQELLANTRRASRVSGVMLFPQMRCTHLNSALLPYRDARPGRGICLVSLAVALVSLSLQNWGPNAALDLWHQV